MPTPYTATFAPGIPPGFRGRFKDLWFPSRSPNASVVLETQGCICLVDAATLAAQSPALATLIVQDTTYHLIDPSGAQHPVVHLPDTCEEVCDLLKVIYRPQSLDITGPLPYDFISRLLRISIRYRIGHIHAQAIGHLERHFPSSLAAWDAIQSGSILPLITGRIPPARVIRLAREMGVLSVLPAALYAACTVGLSFLTAVDGPRHLHLAARDRRACILALELLWKRYVAFLTAAAGHECIAACSGERGFCLSAATSICELSGTGAEYLVPLAPVAEFEMRGMCAGCARVWRGMREVMRRQTWNQLPGLFGLPAWGVLCHK